VCNVQIRGMEGEGSSGQILRVGRPEQQRGVMEEGLERLPNGEKS